MWIRDEMLVERPTEVPFGLEQLCTKGLYYLAY